MYSTPQATTEYYKNNQYPGNKKYVEELKAAYKDSRDKIQKFVNDLKNDAKTDDKEISDMNQQLIAEGEKTIKDIPLGRFADPADDIGRVCVFLASKDASFVTGETITLQGGSGLRP